jgi:hypothetical protein
MSFTGQILTAKERHDFGAVMKVQCCLGAAINQFVVKSAQTAHLTTPQAGKETWKESLKWTTFGFVGN